MILASVSVDGTCAQAHVHKCFTSGSIGAEVFFRFGPEWAELTKTAVFRACLDDGEVTRDVLSIDDAVTIPAEVVARPAHVLRVGVYGVNADGTAAIPTLWADLGRVYSATDPSGDTTTDETLPVWAQLQAEVEQLKQQGADIVGITDITIQEV